MDMFPHKENENMQVTKIDTPQPEVIRPEHDLTKEQLIKELNYMRAQKMTEKMLKKGVITKEEYASIMEENKEVFSPLLASIL